MVNWKDFLMILEYETSKVYPYITLFILKIRENEEDITLFSQMTIAMLTIIRLLYDIKIKRKK